MDFNQILTKIETESTDTVDKGRRFEIVIKNYLKTDKSYSNELSEIYLWEEFPYRQQFGGHDIGIDLVARSRDGWWAVQCKYRQVEKQINKREIDSFLATSSRSFQTEEGDTKFSQRLLATNNRSLSLQAENAIRNQNPSVVWIGGDVLAQAAVHWEKLYDGIYGQAAHKEPRSLKSHQQDALKKALEHFTNNDRGRLIMACGTGKTMTSLRIAEAMTEESGWILFLVPSIALLSQTLIEWNNQIQGTLSPICICSDAKITSRLERLDKPGVKVTDLMFRATTDKELIKERIGYCQQVSNSLKVVFSTYQSIDAVIEAQRAAGIEFDLVICDEAHRTTGLVYEGEDEKHFVKIHSQDNIKTKKRMYMTATPRIYSEASKKKAGDSNIVVHSMDDPKIYGEEFYYLSFGKAVELGELSDYKVLVLTLNADDVPQSIQKMLAGEDDTINADGLSKLIGCINALSKHIIGDGGALDGGKLEDAMKRSVAFCSNIKNSKAICKNLNEKGVLYKEQAPEHKRDSMVEVKARHIDGTMSASVRNEFLSWLKDENTPRAESRILTNVRCLSEGVDVPSLDAVMFLSDKNSQIDVVQSVGRVMRKAPGKTYGYIILPIVVDYGADPKHSLDTSAQYKVVWYVLNALRAHDERLKDTINKIALNKIKPDQIIVGRPDRVGVGAESDQAASITIPISEQVKFEFSDFQNALYAKMVEKVGERGYFTEWAQNVAKLADRHIKRIARLVKREGAHKQAFADFLDGLRQNINPAVTAEQAIEMLAQHIISKPVFESLFEGYSFSKDNAVSQAMEGILSIIEDQSLEEEDKKSLASLYDYVKKKVSGIDNAAGKQKVIVELYDKFFSAGFPKLVEQLGIVYTPVEVVDFIIHSVNDILKQEFNKSLSDQGVSILDPFTGTGTFITRLLQSGLIEPKDLERKYKHEIFANEIVLLAYYIAAINIENTYHDLAADQQYASFSGVILADTFQMTEDSQNLIPSLQENSERIKKQKEAPIRVIISNPPYSAGQKSANDATSNQKYPKLHQRINLTYAQLSTSKSVRTLYDSYIKAFRWSADRIDPDKGGVIAFVSNGSWLEDASKDGFRASLEKEFSSIYVFNVRGNQRTSGELSKREGGKIFGSGSRTPVSITLLVKKPNSDDAKAIIYYCDIGDYLSREQKLAIIHERKSVLGKNMGSKWQEIQPNQSNDWINQRRSFSKEFFPVTQEMGSILSDTTLGIATNRDAWVYSFSLIKLKKNMQHTINFYNQEVDRYIALGKKLGSNQLDDFTNNDPVSISWSESLRQSLIRSKHYGYKSSAVRMSLYRPFNKQNLYFDSSFVERPRQFARLLPSGKSNKFILFSGIGTSTDFSVLMADSIASMDILNKNRCIPLYLYSKNQADGLLGELSEEYHRQVNINKTIWRHVESKYQAKIEKEAIFYYVYGLLHSLDYRKIFANNFSKEIPKIPFVVKKEDFLAFVKAGKRLAELHINYEKIEPYPSLQITGLESGDYQVKKMRFKNKDSKDTIAFNNSIVIGNISERAYDYILNGKSAIEWVMERYQIKTDKASNITNDPNNWGGEMGNPRYIFDLLCSVINVSMKTLEIMDNLPKIKL